MIAEEVVDEIFGLGPLEPILRDPAVTRVEIRAFDEVWVERKGRTLRANVTFRDPAHTRHILDRALEAARGLRIDQAPGQTVIHLER